MDKEKLDKRKRLKEIYKYGVEEKFIDRLWLKDLILGLLEYDDFVKVVDDITGSKISEKENLSERKEELNLIVHNTARGLIVVNLALKYLSHLADIGLNELLDEYWRDRVEKFEGFK